MTSGPVSGLWVDLCALLPLLPQLPACMSAPAATATLASATHLRVTAADKPWGWMMPARHPLGALLFEAGRTEEAEAVYRADLERHPNNGWALRGLAKCLAERGATDEVATVERAFEAAWRGADVEITASCLCARR